MGYVTMWCRLSLACTPTWRQTAKVLGNIRWVPRASVTGQLSEGFGHASAVQVFENCGCLRMCCWAFGSFGSYLFVWASGLSFNLNLRGYLDDLNLYRVITSLITSGLQMITNIVKVKVRRTFEMALERYRCFCNAVDLSMNFFVVFRSVPVWVIEFRTAFRTTGRPGEALSSI